MAVTLQTIARNGACNGLVDLVDVGSGTATGKLKIGTTGMGTILATLNFSNPAFGAAAVGVATAAAIADDTNAANSGTAAAFQFVDRDAALILAGSVGVGGADINLNTTTITAGDTVSITALTVTMPAS